MFFFSTHISFRCPHDLNAWKRQLHGNKSLLQEGHINDMSAKWLSLTHNPPYIPIFYTLTVASVAGVERG